VTDSIAFVLREAVDASGEIAVVPLVDDVELTDRIHAFERERGMETRAVSYDGLFSRSSPRLPTITSPLVGRSAEPMGRPSSSDAGVASGMLAAHRPSIRGPEHCYVD
jgi:hypothetical protein